MTTLVQPLKRSVRGSAGLPVRIEAPGGTHVGVVENFSCSGMFVQTEASLDIGAHVHVEVALPLGGHVTLHGTVARVLAVALAEQLGRRPGLGLCFDDEQPNDPDHLLMLGQLLVNTRALADMSDAADDVVHGDLAQIPLRSVLSFLDVARKSGRLVLEHASSHSVAFVLDGMVWGCDLGPLLDTSAGSFRFEPAAVGEPSGPTAAIADVLRARRPDSIA